MKHPGIASVVLVWGLTGCARTDRMDGQSGIGSNSGELLLLLFVGVVLYLALSHLVASLWRRASRTGDSYSFDLASRRVWLQPKRSHRRRRPRRDNGTDRRTSVVDPASRPPAQYRGPRESA